MPEEIAEMSQATKELLLKVRKFVPPMLEKFHKGRSSTHQLNLLTDIFLGQMGRIAVIGGSEDYTGAPYFSAMASAKLGADMVYFLRFTAPQIY